jgi:hypothetical protein
MDVIMKDLTPMSACPRVNNTPQLVLSSIARIVCLAMTSIAIHFLIYFLMRPNDEISFFGLIIFALYLFICYTAFWYFMRKEMPRNSIIRFIFGYIFLIVFSFPWGLSILFAGSMISGFSKELPEFSLMYTRSYSFIYLFAVLFPFLGALFSGDRRRD